MKIKVSAATPPQLNWMVAKAIGEYKPVAVPAYSTDWAQAGPIIEREEMTLLRFGDYPNWTACLAGCPQMSGPTPLVAAMRCYVASKMGDEIEIPEELK